jgi:Zn-dependent protease with chaperone function
MNEDQIKLLIERLEPYAAQNPGKYRLRLTALAALGYAYLLSVVVGLLTLAFVILAYVRFNAITIKIAWIPLVIAWLVLRSLWITIPPPDGIEIKHDQAPELFDLVNETRKILAGPMVHHVLLSTEFNAGIVQIPRFGMFGVMRNYLVVGVPLISALDPKEFKAVLAHEFGHLSGRHGRFSGWIYRIRLSWIQILVQIKEGRNYASWLFEPFLNWYAPFFNAYSFVLARMQEYEADTYSADISGRRVAARALIKLSVKDRALMDVVWPEIFRPARFETQPPRNVFDLMLKGLTASVERAKAETWFLEALRVKTGYDDTHPSLRDRLVGLDFEPQKLEALNTTDDLFLETNETAAQTYLKEVPDEIMGSFNRLLKEGIAQGWRERHEAIKQAEERLRELEQKEQTDALTTDELWERARCISETQDNSAALPVVQIILSQTPDHVGANYAAGSIMLENSDVRGIEYLEKAMELNPATTGDACELVYGFYRSLGQQAEADRFRVRASAYYEKLQRLHEQASNVTAKDRFEPHDLSRQELQQLQSELATIRGLSLAYLVRKIIPEADEPLYVLGIVPGHSWDNARERDSAELMSDIVNQVSFSRSSVYLTLEGKNELLQELFAGIAGSKIYPQ